MALKIQEELLGKNTKWCKERWKKGTVIENDELKWDFKFHLRKTTTVGQPDVTIKYTNKNKIFLIYMVCSCANNVDAKHAEKLQKYQLLAFEIWERRPGYNVMIISIVIGCLGGGMRRAANQIGRLISDEKKTRATLNEMVKTVLFESKSITRKVLSGLIQEEWLIVFVRIPTVNGLPNFVSPNDALSHKGEHNKEIPLLTPTSRFLFSVIGDHYGLYFIIYTHM